MSESNIFDGMNSRVIAAVRNQKEWKEALDSPVSAVFLLFGDVLNLGELVAGARRAGKPVFVHLDFIEGIAADKSGIRYIAEKIRPSGVISTRHHLIAAARERGLKAVQRLFLIDSTAVDKGLKAIRSTAPDAVEVMPGLMPKVIAEIVEKTSIPVIAGGLIREEEEVRSALRAGAVAVSVGDPRLWEVKTG